MSEYQNMPSDVAELLESRDVHVAYTDWGLLKEKGYDTKTNYKFDRGLVPRPGERKQAVFADRKVMTRKRWEQVREDWERYRQEIQDDPNSLGRFESFMRRVDVASLPGGRIVVTTAEIPLFHRSQMQEGNFRARTKAIIEYGRVFWRSSNRSSYIKKNLQPEKYDAKWFTKGFGQEKVELEPVQFLNEKKLLDHINQRQIYGVKADASKPQWWGGADLDLHIETGGRPEIFLRQVEAVLSHLHGKGWLICLGTDVVNGIHVIKINSEPRTLAQVRQQVHDTLAEISALHPDLERQTAGCGMRSIRDAEIFPSAAHGFRLPLGIGYTALTDRPLGLVHYHTHNGHPLFGADVVGLMTWDETEMPLKAKLDYIRARVPQNSADEDNKIKKTVARLKVEVKQHKDAVAEELADSKVLGSMKGRYRNVLVDFYSGRTQVPKSLQVGILLGANALWAIEHPLEERTDYLLDLLQAIKITNPSFSSRLNAGAWEEIRDDIDHVVETVEAVRSDPEATAKIKHSNELLRHWAAAMKKASFNFADPSTWDNCWEGAERDTRYTFVPTEKERELIATHIAPVFACHPDLAVEAVIKMVRLAAIKYTSEDGMDREYRRALLTDIGIACRENTKLARCWDIVEEAGFIHCRKEAVFTPGCPGRGRARTYGVGRRVLERVHGVRPEDRLDLPQWLQETLVEDGHFSPWFMESSRRSAGSPVESTDDDPQWAELKRGLIKKMSS